MQSGISLHFVDAEVHRRRENRGGSYVTSRAKIEQITRRNVRRARGEKMMRGKIMEKPSVPMTRLVIRKRANGSRRCNENNCSPGASKDIARVY